MLKADVLEMENALQERCDAVALGEYTLWAVGPEVALDMLRVRKKDAVGGAVETMQHVRVLGFFFRRCSTSVRGSFEGCFCCTAAAGIDCRVLTTVRRLVLSFLFIQATLFLGGIKRKRACSHVTYRVSEH